MKNKIVFNAPINGLSFGNVSYNLLREMWKRKMDVSFFPIGQNLQFDSFDKIDKEFVAWFKESLNGRLKTVTANTPTLKLWHLSGAHERITRDQYLLTFYELDQPTREEISMINLQEKVFVSSAYTRDLLKLSGVDESKVVHVPLGFDEDFEVIEMPRLGNTINFSLMGKWEKRKHTAKIISLWAKKFGNNPKYQLHCLVTNPFLAQNPQQLPQVMNQVIGQALEGKRYSNINFLPKLETNTHLNRFMNGMDIDLTGLSGAEGWNLPAFNSAALGKWSVVLNATSHKDWATPENSVIVEPNGKTTAIDGIFFQPNQPFNQGNIFTWDDEEALAAMEKAVDLVKRGTKNDHGLKLQEEFKYSKTLDAILDNIKS